jgi:hypothetical protein
VLKIPCTSFPPCDRCQFYARSSYTVCAVHPKGVEEKRCLDFREDPKAEPQELWEPENARYIDENLVLERSYYNGEEIAPPQRQLTPEQQWQVLESHPLFTGHCPRCSYQFPSHVPELIHFDCPECGWIDDSV